MLRHISAAKSAFSRSDDAACRKALAEARGVVDSLRQPELMFGVCLQEAECAYFLVETNDSMPEIHARLQAAVATETSPTHRALLHLHAAMLHLRSVQLPAARLDLARAVQALPASAADASRHPLKHLHAGLLALVQGLVATQDQEYHAVTEALARAIAHLTKVPAAHHWHAFAHAEMGYAYDELGNTDRAIAYGRQSTILHEAAFGRMHRQTAMAYRRLGRSCVIEEFNDDALNAYQQCMDILRQVYGPEHPEVYKSHNGLGNCYSNLRDSVRAEAAYFKALRGVLSTDGPNSMAVARIYRNLGILHKEFNNPALARQYWLQDVAIIKKVQGPTTLDVATHLSWIADTYDREGQYDLALSTINTALKTLHPHADTSLGACNGTAIQADAAGQLAFARAINIKGTIHHNRYLALHKKADLDCAYASLRLGLATSDSVRMGYHGAQAQLGGLDVSYQYFEEILKVCLAQYQVQKDPQWLDRAFFYMEKSKSNLLNSAIRLSSVSNQHANLQWLGEERALRRQIDSLEIKSYELGKSGLPKHHPDLVRLRQEIFHAQEDLQTFLSEVQATDPQYYALRYGTQVPSLAEMRQSLPDANTLLLEYFVGEDNLFILAMSAADVRIVQLPLDSLGSEVEAFLRQFDARSHNLLHAKRNFIESAQALYARLIRPVADLLPDQGRIVVVPDGKLGYVPFEALLNDAVAIAPTTAYRDMPYLLRSHSVGYASSAVAMRLIAPRERRKSEMRLLAFAPTFENEQLSGAYAQATTVENKAVAATRSAMIQSPLHYTSEEVQRISRYFKGEVFQGSAATESQFKRSAQDYNILHFATHGDIQDGNPMFSGIAFSAEGEGEAGKEDGMLHTLELFDMDLQAELAVLSACNTGKGVIQRGEGVMSLARGFMYAGCPSIVMSLWSVDDAASASIMDEFYRQLSKGKSKDAALRAAKFSYLDAADESKAHPYYWAAHVMIGDPSGFRGNYQGWAWGAVILCLVAVIVVFEVRKYA